MGNTEAERAWEKLVRACGHAVLALTRESGTDRLGQVQITSVRFKLDADNNSSVLAVLKGTQDGAFLVAFVGGPDLATVILSVGQKVQKEALKWREDRPWGE